MFFEYFLTFTRIDNCCNISYNSYKIFSFDTFVKTLFSISTEEDFQSLILFAVSFLRGYLHVSSTITVNFVDYLKISNSGSARLNLMISQPSSFSIVLCLSISYLMLRFFWPFLLHPVATFQLWKCKSIL